MPTIKSMCGKPLLRSRSPKIKGKHLVSFYSKLFVIVNRAIINTFINVYVSMRVLPVHTPRVPSISGNSQSSEVGKMQVGWHKGHVVILKIPEKPCNK